MKKNAADIPHKVGSAEIASPELKKIVMQFMENFLALGGQIADLHSALREVASRPVVSPEIEDIETYVARAESAASTATSAKNAAVAAKEAAVPAGQTATTKAGEASVSAQNAATSETNASGYATSASQAALSASQSAASAESSAAAAAAGAATANWSTAFQVVRATALVYTGTGAVDEFPVRAFVPDASPNAAYEATAYFRFRTAVNAGNKRYCKLSADTSDPDRTATWTNVTESAASGEAISKGQVESATIEVTGADTLHVLNGGSSDTVSSGNVNVDVYLKIAKKNQEQQQGGQ